jgi:outer membrane protein assembly factor BamB
MKKSHLLVILILFGVMIVLSACVPGPRVTGSPGITMSDDSVFVSYRNFLYRLNASTGSVDWHYPAEANNSIMFYSQPLVTENYVYVGDLANNFHKIDIATGSAEWTFSEGKGYFIGKPAEADGIIYAPSDDGRLYAINESGESLWSFKTGHYLWSQPQISDDAIFLGSMDHFVYSITKDGEEIWSYEMGGAVVGSPVLSEDGTTLYAGSIGKDLVALDAANGEPRWSFEAEGSIWGGPVLANDLLYFADSSGNLYALDPQNGEQAFQTEFEGSAVGGLTVIEDGLVLTTENGGVKAFNFDGSSLWEASLDGEIFQAPAVNQDYLIIGTINGENLLYAYNMSGVQRWSITPEN